MLKRIVFILVAVLSVGVARADGQAYAVIVVGAPNSPMYTRHYADRSARFTKAVEAAGISGDRLTVMPSDSTASAVTDALAKAVAKPTAGDQFILIILGHGQLTDAGPTLMLNGPDLTFKTIADQLKPLKAKSQVVLNFSAASGDALALLAQKGRVNLTTSSPQQVNDSDLAEFFLQELERKGGEKSVLDLYNRSTQAWARWVVRQKTLPPAPEGAPPAPLGWMVEGRESTALFKKLYGYDDTPANRKYIASPDSEKPDEVDPPVVTNSSPRWAERRVISESPVIDDAVSDTPVSALSEKGFSAVVPSKECGEIAAMTVLGKAEPLKSAKPQAAKPSTSPTSMPVSPVEP